MKNDKYFENKFYKIRDLEDYEFDDSRVIKILKQIARDQRKACVEAARGQLKPLGQWLTDCVLAAVSTAEIE